MNFLQKFNSWFDKTDKYLSPMFFIVGFIFDNLTLTRIDLFFDNLVLLNYLLIASLSIFLINFVQSKKIDNEYVKYLPLATQFAFGGLFSGYAIFYTKSASWATSWFFLLLIYLFFIGNERFRKHYEKIEFQIGVLFVAIFSFLIFFVPVVSKRIGDDIFLLSGLLALLVTGLFIFLLFSITPHKKAKKKVLENIFLIFIVFNTMYFLNIIPPVPLSMKEIGVYYGVQRTLSGDYVLEGEKSEWFEFYKKWKNEIFVQGGKVFVYSSVFAPTDLNTKVVYVWRKYNEQSGKWIVFDEIVYPITGGREDGYRGYTYITNATAGLWRVDVENKNGQVLGRVKFEIVNGKKEGSWLINSNN